MDLVSGGGGGALLDDVDTVELLQGADLPDRGLADAVLQPLQRDLLEGDDLACNMPLACHCHMCRGHEVTHGVT